jgi:hypothetical protein
MVEEAFTLKLGMIQTGPVELFSQSPLNKFQLEGRRDTSQHVKPSRKRDTSQHDKPFRRRDSSQRDNSGGEQ